MLLWHAVIAHCIASTFDVEEIDHQQPKVLESINLLDSIYFSMNVVELNGLEPSTSGLQSPRSPS